VLVHKTENGDFLISREELAVLRAGLFVTIYHLDPAFDEDLHSISGFDLTEFDTMLRRVDEVAAH
jgi:hypothetical protein